MELSKVINDLKNGTVFVSFKKKDGTQRDMECTLKDIPDDAKKRKTNIKVVDYNPDQVRCYDLEKKAWRSFLLSSVTSITVR